MSNLQAAILLKDGTDVKGKFVYGGDISTPTMNVEIARLEAKYPIYTVQFFSTDQDSTFVSAVVNSPLEMPF